jgi:hypothetical protein
VRPDVAVVIYNDHGLNFFLDTLPAFAVGAAESYANADEGWGLPPVRPFPGDLDLSWHLIESLIHDEFGVEFVMWLGARGALHLNAHGVHRNYHVPISNTAAGVIVMESAA